MTRMEIAMRFVLCLLLVGFLSACGGGGGGSALSGGDLMTDMSVVSDGSGNGILPEGLQAGNPLPVGQQGVAEQANALTHLENRLGVASADLPRSFYEQLMSPEGVTQNGNAGDYRIVLRERDDVKVNREGDDYNFQHFVDAFIIYSHIVLHWDLTTDTAGRVRRVRGNNYVDHRVLSFSPSPTVPDRGEASYGLDGRALLTRWAGTDFDTEKESYEVIMTGQLDANFVGDGSVEGYLESKHAYQLPDPRTFGAQEVLYRVPQDISRLDFFGDDGAASGANGNVRIAIGYHPTFITNQGNRFGKSRFNGAGDLEVYNAGNAAFTFSPFCGTRSCFGAELFVTEETGIFKGLVNPDGLGGIGQNLQGHTIGIFLGPNHEELLGHFSVQNSRRLGGGITNDRASRMPINRLEGFYIGEKQSEQNQ